MPIEITLDHFKTHIYSIGGTRTGKTNLQLVIQDILFSPENQKQYPCALIYVDVHGDAGLQLPRMQQSLENVTILDPDYVNFSLNPLELPPLPDPKSPDYRKERAMAVQNQVEQMSIVMREMFSTSSEQAPRLMWIVRGALYFLYAITFVRSDEEGKPVMMPTFLDLYLLLKKMMVMDEEELEEMLRSQSLSDDVINNTMEAISKLDEAAFAAAMNRISNFVLPQDSITSRTFCRRESRLKFDEIIKPGRLTVFRLPKSNLPDDFRAMLTSAIILRIYFMVQRRARELERSASSDDPSQGRTPIHLTIDEFQNIAKLGIFGTIMSEAAKFGLFLHVSHQNISQIPPDLYDTIIGNAGLISVFRVGPSDAHELAKLMAPKEEEWARALVRLPNWTCVLRLNPEGGGAMAKVVPWVDVPKARAPVHTAQEIIRFMKTEMEKKFGSGTDLSTVDKEPLYMAAIEEARVSRGIPELTPAAANILFVLSQRIPPEIKYKDLSLLMQELHGWEHSVTLGALNYLVERGLIHDAGLSYSSSASKDTKDELERSRETTYVLSDFARTSILAKQLKGRRAGDNLHWHMMSALVRYYRNIGWWCTVDYGESKDKWPDIILFRLKRITVAPNAKKNKSGTVREYDDPRHWDVQNRIAVEVETSPRKSQSQVMENYEKSVGEYRLIIFYVASEDHANAVREILSRKPPGTYDVKVLNNESLHLDHAEFERIIAEGSGMQTTNFGDKPRSTNESSTPPHAPSNKPPDFDVAPSRENTTAPNSSKNDDAANVSDLRERVDLLTGNLAVLAYHVSNLLSKQRAWERMLVQENARSEGAPSPSPTTNEQVAEKQDDGNRATSGDAGSSTEAPASAKSSEEHQEESSLPGYDSRTTPGEEFREDKSTQEIEQLVREGWNLTVKKVGERKYLYAQKSTDGTQRSRSLGLLDEAKAKLLETEAEGKEPSQPM